MDIRPIKKYQNCAYFRLTFAYLTGKQYLRAAEQCNQNSRRTLGASTLTACPQSPVKEGRVDKTLNPFHHKIGTRSLCQPAWCAVPVNSDETNAPGNGFSRQRAGSRSCTDAKANSACASFTHYVLVLSSITPKSVGDKSRGLQSKIEEGSGGVC